MPLLLVTSMQHHQAWRLAHVLVQLHLLRSTKSEGRDSGWPGEGTRVWHFELLTRTFDQVVCSKSNLWRIFSASNCQDGQIFLRIWHPRTHLELRPSWHQDCKNWNQCHLSLLSLLEESYWFQLALTFRVLSRRMVQFLWSVYNRRSWRETHRLERRVGREQTRPVRRWPVEWSAVRSWDCRSPSAARPEPPEPPGSLWLEDFQVHVQKECPR